MIRKTTDGQDQFLSDAGEKRFLSRAEVARLIKKSRDEALPLRERLRARNKIVESNVLLVSHWAHKYAAKHTFQHLKIEDLMQEGVEGLIRACETFDPDMGNAFSTYATWWINQKIRRSIHDKDRTVRVPVHKLEIASRVYQMKQELAANLDREPTEDEFWQAFSDRYSDEIVRKAYYNSDLLPPHTYSLNHTYVSEGAAEEAGQELMDMMESEDDDPEAEVQRNILRERVMHLLEGLPEKHRIAVKMWYAIEPYERKYTLDEIGRRLGVSREMARQFRLKAHKHLAEIMDPRTGMDAEGDQGQLSGWHTAFDHVDVRKMRESKGWSQQVLANRAQVSYMTVARVERGDVKLSELNPKVKDRLAVQLDLLSEASVKAHHVA